MRRIVSEAYEWLLIDLFEVQREELNDEGRLLLMSDGDASRDSRPLIYELEVAQSRTLIGSLFARKCRKP